MEDAITDSVAETDDSDVTPQKGAGSKKAGPERLCVVTRQNLAQAEMIRFALSPDGEIVPDVEGRLPGRGVWLSCSREILKKAIQSKAFSRSLKQQAAVPAGLEDKVEALLTRRVGEYLSFANKAGQVVAGFQQVDAALEKGALAAVLHGSDAADDGQQKLDRKFKAIQRERGAPAPVVNVLTIAEMSLAMGRPSVVHAGLIPGGLTERFLDEAGRLARYRSDRGVSDQSFSIEHTNEG